MAKKEIIGKIKYSVFPNMGVFEEDENIFAVKRAIPGQTVIANPKRKKAGLISCTLKEVLEKSNIETNPLSCKHFNMCGGCSYQSIEYEDELKIKKDELKRLFQDIYKKDFKLTPSPIKYEYRNKMEYTFGDEIKGGKLVAGLHKINRFYEIVDVCHCNIVNKDFEIIRNAIQEYFRNKNESFFHKVRKIGFLRHLVLRYSFYENAFMINIVTTSQKELDADFLEYVKNIKIDGKIKTIIHTINDSDSDAVIGEKIKILFGDGYIIEKINNLLFKISPFSFFQPNVLGAQNLYNKAIEFLGDISGKTVFDMYSGTGTIAQIMSKNAKKVVAIEIVEEAVQMAKENAKLNGITNVEFVAKDVFEFVKEINKSPDAMVIDPPRSGINPKAIKNIIDFNAKKIVYISCNPKTMRIDLDSFLENGYKLEKLEFFDQFPKTPHVESVVLMTRVAPTK